MDAAALLQDSSGWAATLRLGFARNGLRTALVDRWQRGPLMVQRPFYPEEEVCHCYLLHPPGGVVGGDELDIQVNVEPEAHALLTTPGATKFYRSGGAQAQQTQHLRVDGTLEWLPQESILFAGADVRLNTRVELGPGARFLGWEILVLGRPSAGERFQGNLGARLEVWQAGEPRLIEQLRVGPGGGALGASAGLRDQPLSASFLAWPTAPAHLAVARAALPPLAEELCAFSLVDGLLVGRYLGQQAEQARRCFIPVWQALRPLLLGREAVPPRVWAT